MTAEHPKDPLHGVTLKAIMEDLIARRGWDELANQIEIRCFANDPSLKSSLKFLRKTPWARDRVERLYLDDQRKLERRRKQNQRRAARRAYGAELEAQKAEQHGAEPEPSPAAQTQLESLLERHLSTPATAPLAAARALSAWYAELCELSQAQGKLEEVEALLESRLGMDIRDPIELRAAAEHTDAAVSARLEALGLDLDPGALASALTLPSGLLPAELRTDLELLSFEDFSFTTPGGDAPIVGSETGAYQSLRYALVECHHTADEPFELDDVPEPLRPSLERVRLEQARLVVIAGLEDAETGVYCPVVASFDHVSPAYPLPVFVLYTHDELFWRYVAPSPPAMVGAFVDEYLRALTRLLSA